VFWIDLTTATEDVTQGEQSRRLFGPGNQLALWLFLRFLGLVIAGSFSAGWLISLHH
jgi:hypothetical protein